MSARFDVLIPARARSVGLPGKNSRVLVDRPLFMHSIACASALKGVGRILVSTDDPVIGQMAADAGAYVPELRPPHLATSRTPMPDVIRYATGVLANSSAAESLLLLDPTSPMRVVSDINRATELLDGRPDVDGVISISCPSFNPLWVGVDLAADQRVRRHRLNEGVFARRQDVPQYWRVNGSFYIWRKRYCSTMGVDWLDSGIHLGWETRELLSHSIDTEDDFRLVEALLHCGVVDLEWMGQ